MTPAAVGAADAVIVILLSVLPNESFQAYSRHFCSLFDSRPKWANGFVQGIWLSSCTSFTSRNLNKILQRHLITPDLSRSPFSTGFLSLFLTPTHFTINLKTLNPALLIILSNPSSFPTCSFTCDSLVILPDSQACSFDDSQFSYVSHIPCAKLWFQMQYCNTRARHHTSSGRPGHKWPGHQKYRLGTDSARIFHMLN